MRAFKMIRNADETGVSGIGHVLDGVEFDNKMVAVCWRSDTPSVNVYLSFEDFNKLHVASHPTNKTEIIWLDVEGI